MKIAGWTSVVYAIIVFIGGMIGYATAGSSASAISGAVCGVLMLAAGIGTILGKRTAAMLALAITFILDGFFSYRFMLSFSFMPAGMMAVLTLAALIIQVVGLRRSAGSRHAS